MDYSLKTSLVALVKELTLLAAAARRKLESS